MKRKLISTIVLIVFMFSISSPVFAQGESAKIGQEQAMKIARDKLQIPANLKNVQMSYREETYWGSKKVWEFVWDDSQFGRWHSYRAEVDADTGEIVSYSEDRDWNNYKLTSKAKTKEECKAIAESFIKKISPEKFTQLKEISLPEMDYRSYYPTNEPRRYNFSYQRVVNGIPFPDNSINVNINEDGKVLNYYSNWDNNAGFPKALPTVTSDAAEKIFKDKIGLRLNYLQFGYYPANAAMKKPVRLYYSAADNYYSPPVMIDAVSGKIVDQFGKEITVQNKVYLAVTPEPVPGNGDGKLLTLDEAKAKIKDYVTIPQNYISHSTRYSEGWGNGAQKVWDFQYGPADFRGGASLNVGINAVTGELVQYHRWEEGMQKRTEGSVEYNYEACKKIASEFLKKVAPGKADYIYLHEPVTKPVWYAEGKIMEPPTYSFTFQRVVNGILFPSNQINVDVDNKTGEIRGFWTNWEQTSKFADHNAIITEQEAMNKLMSVEKPTLVYAYKQQETGMRSKEIMLVYRMFRDVPRLVDAADGKVVTNFELENPVILEDIRGHWAERDVQTLASWGIITGNKNKFNPDKSVTRAEFVNMLVLAKGLEIDSKAAQSFKDVPVTAWYSGAVEAAAKAGLIKGSAGKFNPDQKITRQEMVVMLINTVNNDLQSTDPADLATKFKDAGTVALWAEKKVAQAVEMGIIYGQNGYLKPVNPATRAEAAAMLMKLLGNEKFGGGARAIYGKW